MSLQKGETTTTSGTQYPQYIQDAQQLSYGLGAGATLPFASQMPKYQVAGMTEDQMRAGELARSNAMQAFNTDFSGRIMDAGGGWGAATVGGDDIRGLMNPYLEDVGRSTLGNMRREHGATDARIGARNASAVGFGGSGAALERAQLNRAHGENVGTTINSLMSQGWDRASTLAAENARAENAARSGSAQLGLNAGIAANNAFTSNMGRQQDALSTLLDYGTRTQGQAQRTMDAPWVALQRYMSMIPREQGTQTSSTPNYINPLETALGFAGLF